MTEQPTSVEVTHPTDVAVARRNARSLAADIGFSERVAAEIELVVSELGQNVLKHGRGGAIRLHALPAARPGLRIEAVDAGPGLPDPTTAFADGHSSIGTLGYGLGSVWRLMDDVEVSRGEDDVGTCIVAERWLPRKQRDLGAPPLAVRVLTRRHPRARENGDAYVLHRSPGVLLAGVIDGLGHGRAAAEAAQAVRYWVERHGEQPLPALFAGAHRAAAGTRGGVMALARICWSDGRLELASLGNVEARYLEGGATPRRPLPLRGIVGAGGLMPRVSEHPWGEGGVLVLHSDGVNGGWSWRELVDARGAAIAGRASNFFARHALDHDDATLVVVAATYSESEDE